MADELGLDPARIERLRNPARYAQVDPLRLWEILPRPNQGTIVDVGAGVGFVTLPIANDCPDTTVVACDLLAGMLDYLQEDATAKALTNIECRLMKGVAELPISDQAANLIMMLQVHHELDDPQGLVNDCARVLAPGGTLAIIDWKDEDLDGVPPAGRRVPPARIIQEMRNAGLADVRSHAMYSHHSCITGRRV